MKLEAVLEPNCPKQPDLIATEALFPISQERRDGSKYRVPELRGSL
jgi:hypothetical protein